MNHRTKIEVQSCAILLVFLLPTGEAEAQESSESVIIGTMLLFMTIVRNRNPSWE